MDNLDRIQEIMQCVGRLWNDCPVEHNAVRDDLQTIVDNIQIIKKELLESEPVRRGVWVADTWCSVCSRFPVDVSCHISNQELTKQFSRCPHCGAKMSKCTDDDGSGVGQAFSHD